MPGPLRIPGAPATPVSPRLKLPGAPAPEPESEGPGMGAALAGGAALLGGAALTRNPGMLGKGLKTLNSLRQQLMLSGYALPKQILGTVGAAGVASAERGSMSPLKQLFSRQTLRDVGAAYKNPKGAIEYGTMHGPGRAIGAIDEAAQKAFGRAGIGVEEAEAMTFQTPLNKRYGKLGDALDSPAARYLIPFRRTPFNQLWEGLEIAKNPMANPKTLAAIGGAGIAHGAATSEERYPASVGLGAALAAKYGAPYALAALIGRRLAGAKDSGGVAATALPISEYGIESSIVSPTKPFTDPAILRVLRQIAGE